METINATCIPCELKHNTWYSLSPVGHTPSCRVGHTAVLLPKTHKVAILGGATPDEVYDEIWILNTHTLQCEQIAVTGGFTARYEHSTFINSESKEDNPMLWVFAGASMCENKNDLWLFDLNKKEWKKINQSGQIPTPRTHHACILDEVLTVFGGGFQISDPVADQNVYQLDSATGRWKVVSIQGEPPEPRHGHAIVSVHGQLFCHGGMAGSNFLDDLHVLETNGHWKKIEDSTVQPSARAAHSAVHYEGIIYVFGGLGKAGVLNDLWKLHISSLVWEQVTVDSSSPLGRLDFAMSVIHLPHYFSELEDDDNLECKSNIDKSKLIACILVHGGMNDKGVLFDDFHIFKLSVCQA